MINKNATDKTNII